MTNSNEVDSGGVCGIQFKKFSRPIQFSVCVFIIFFLFILYGYYQELIFHVKELKQNGMFVTLVQFGFYALFGLQSQIISERKAERTPLRLYLLLACLTIGTMGFSNTSLGYLNYPTQVIFKSSKLVPVMVGGILIQGKTYRCLDFLACLLMTFGLIIFSYGDQKLSPNFDWRGILLISLALCCDAMIGNFQELILKKYKSSNSEMVFYSYGIGFCYLLIFHVLYGGFGELALFLLKNPKNLVMIFLFSVTGYIGILFVLQLVRSFGALIAVTVTTCRKAVTIVLSFVFFTKPFTMQYLWGGLLVLLGIALNVASKNEAQIKEAWYKFQRRRRPNDFRDELPSIV